jgi:predicted transcriptional regulator of viral defense system
MAVSSSFFKKRLYAELPPIFTHKNLSSVLSMRASYRLIREWVSGSLAIKIGRGVYAKAASDPYYISSRGLGGYLSFSSSLYVRRLKNETESRIFVAVPSASKGFSLPGVEAVPVGMGKFFFGDETLERNGLPLRIATYAKTLFDMCHRPRYADFYSMYRAMNWKPFSSSDWEELARYCAMAPLSTLRRVGYIVEGKAPKKVLRKLESLNSSGGVSFLFGRGGEYSSKWRLYDSQNVRRWIDEA